MVDRRDAAAAPTVIHPAPIDGPSETAATVSQRPLTVVLDAAHGAGHVLRWHPFRMHLGPPAAVGAPTVVPEWGEPVRHPDVPLTAAATTISFGSGDSPSAEAVSPDGTRLYVTNFSRSTVSVLDAVHPTAPPNTVAVGDGPGDLVLSTDGTHAYVLNQGSESVSVIDTTRPSTAPTTMGLPRGSVDSLSANSNI